MADIELLTARRKHLSLNTRTGEVLKLRRVSYRASPFMIPQYITGFRIVPPIQTMRDIESR